jgi:hypothetical protein
MKTHTLRKALAGGLLAFVLMAATSASSALAEVQYIIDPQLSLTGDCSTSEVDPIPDPSCPYDAVPAGPSEPFSAPFSGPAGMAIDSYGDLYVVVPGPVQPGEQQNPHIDVFDAEGRFLTEVSTPKEPRTVAVDSNGYLYVCTNTYGERLLRYNPTAYDPAGGVVAYEPTPTVFAPTNLEATENFHFASLAVNPENDHLFVNLGGGEQVGLPGPHPDEAVIEFGSAAEGNPLLDHEVAAVAGAGSERGLAIDQSRGRLYVTDKGPDLPGGGSNDEGLRLIRVFELAAPHHLIETLDGSSLPDGTFVKCGYEPENCPRIISLAVDEGTGNLFAFDAERRFVIYEMTEKGQYLATIGGPLQGSAGQQVVVDNGKESPNGALRPDGRYLWADANPRATGHAFAFAPRSQCPPVVESASVAHVGEGEALLQAEVEPCQLETSYRFEYVSAQQFAESGFEGAKVAGQGTIPPGGNPVKLSAGATGLAAGGDYVFRVVAENQLGKDEGQGSFRTYPVSTVSADCPNQSLRTGPSASLPDCRAYELVTPPNTNGLGPQGAGFYGLQFLSRTASPAGNDVFYRIEGGALPDSEGTGSTFGYPYFATRGSQGWSTDDGAGSSREFRDVELGGRSPDLGYSVWLGLVNAIGTNYLRFPDGHSALIGQGSLGTDPKAMPKLISEDGGHLVFGSSLALEPGVGVEGAIYDRTADGVTHVVSLLPGNLPLSIQRPEYLGASPDGLGIAFTVVDSESRQYLRYNNEETYEIGDDVTYEGIAEGGKRVFYLEGGKLYAFDIEDGKIPFATTTDTTVVNISRDGSAAYFVSKSKLTTAANPRGEKAKIGQQNLYLSREGQISFVAAVTERDVVGEGVSGGVTIDGLGTWSEAIAATGSRGTVGALPQDPSRSTADGGVLVFSSRAELTGYDSGGHAELYRYDSRLGTLDCLSCNPTKTAAVGDASLQPIPKTEGTGSVLAGFPTFKYDRIENLSADGRRLFFETEEPLVAQDIDGLRDVYEWEAEGEGSCAEPQGCLYLVSSGQSAHNDFLFGVSESGDDVFILSNDLLEPGRDPDATASIYDARVNGGFPLDSVPAECLGETCQPAARPPDRPAQLLQGTGNVRPEGKRCPKGKRAVRAKGKTRCVRRHKKHRGHHKRTHHKPADTKRGGNHR